MPKNNQIETRLDRGPATPQVTTVSVTLQKKRLQASSTLKEW